MDLDKNEKAGGGGYLVDIFSIGIYPFRLDLLSEINPFKYRVCGMIKIYIVNFVIPRIVNF